MHIGMDLQENGTLQLGRIILVFASEALVYLTSAVDCCGDNAQKEEVKQLIREWRYS